MSQSATAADVAAWMADQLKHGHYLYQEYAARQIHSLFGEEFTYRNKNRNLAIKKAVLDVFNKLTGDKVVWSQSQRMWRRREKWDEPGRKQR